MSHTLKSALESGQEAQIVQIDFSAAFDSVNHLGILYKLCSVGIGGSVLSILTQFLSNRSQQVVVDGCRSKLVNVSGVPQGSVLGPLLFLLFTSELFSILENKQISYADNSTLIAVVPSSGVRVAVAESLIHDLGRGAITSMTLDTLRRGAISAVLLRKRGNIPIGYVSSFS